MRWHLRIRARAGSFNLEADVEGDENPVILIGPNGSGKTTLLRIIAGAYRPLAGRIHAGGRVLFDSEEGIDRPPEERRVGYLPQGCGLFPHLRVIDNVAFGLTSRRRRMDRRARKRAAAEILEQLGFAHLAGRRPNSLSGGEKQRVALARALLTEPEMLLLDEPLAAMDAAARRDFRAYLARHLAECGTPAIVATHDARDVWAFGTPVVYALEGGRIVQKGQPGALAARPATDFIAEFFVTDGVPAESGTPLTGRPRPHGFRTA